MNLFLLSFWPKEIILNFYFEILGKKELENFGTLALSRQKKEKKVSLVYFLKEGRKGKKGFLSVSNWVEKQINSNEFVDSLFLVKWG